jgi:GT2 family glycosyltransferase
VTLAQRTDVVDSRAADASVVICAYTDARWATLTAGVTALDAQTTPPREVILSIDHNDDLAQRARKAFPQALVVANDEKPGLSGARNTGVRHASGKIVVFLDDDARPEPDWLETLIAAFDDPGVVGAGGVALPDWPNGARPAWLPSEMYWVIGCSYTGLPTRPAPVRNPIGANMAFRGPALRAVGGFVTGIGRVGATPLGCEETEIAIRVREATGGTVLHIPEARVFHSVTAARVTWRYFLARCWAEGLSKALVARHVGSERALASERIYATRVLPRGVGRGVRDLLAGDLAGLARALAIVAGLAVTTAGYAAGGLRALWPSARTR